MHDCKLKRDDLTLLALGLSGGVPLTPVQLQKMVFLFQEEANGLNLEERYNFVPYNYGPFCGAVYDDAALLANEGNAEVSLSSSGYRSYRATKQGVASATQLVQKLNKATVTYLRHLCDWVREQSFEDLVRAVYQKYPNFKVHSIFNG